MAALNSEKDQELAADTDILQSLMLSASHLARRALMDILAAFDLTVPQYYALVVIQRAEAGCTMSELAEQTHQVAATMTGIVRRLAERGLVERRADSADRRCRTVDLTQAGAALMEQIDSLRREHNQAIMAQFSAGERQDLIVLMDRYLAALETLTAR